VPKVISFTPSTSNLASGGSRDLFDKHGGDRVKIMTIVKNAPFSMGLFN